MPYIPPHLRPGYTPTVRAQPAPRRRGVHFKSNNTGLPTHNLTMHRYNKNAPHPTMRQIIRTRLLSKSKLKSAIKGKTNKRRAKSANPERRVHVTRKAKSK